MIDASTEFLRETEALPDPQRPAEEVAVEMVAYLDQLPEDQGREYARAMIKRP